MLPLDERYRPLRPSILYGIDTRASAEIDELTQTLGTERVFERTGQFLTSQSVGPKVLWYRRNEPELYSRTRKVVTAATYLVYRLTGRFVVDNYVAPYFTPFFNVERLAWDPEFVEPICPVEWLPETLWATESAGVVTQQAAEETGIPAGTPVAVGTADAAAEAISAGAIDPGDLMVMYGTTMFLIQALDTYRRHRSLWASVHCVPGQAALAAGMSTSGALLHWFRDEFGQVEREVEENWASAPTNCWATRRQVHPAAADLSCRTSAANERPSMIPTRGLIMGLTLTHGRGHIYRSCLGRHRLWAATQHRDHGGGRRNAEAPGGRRRRRSRPALAANLQRCDRHAAGIPERTVGAYGDAYLAGYAAGIFSNSKLLKQKWVKIARTVEPDRDARLFTMNSTTSTISVSQYARGDAPSRSKVYLRVSVIRKFAVSSRKQVER
jgi:xylulokinase